MSTRPDHALSAITEADYLSAVDRLYEALVPPASRSTFVERLAALVSCSGGQYLCLEQGTGRLLSSCFVGFPAELNAAYLNYWFHHDPRLSSAPVASGSGWACHHQPSREPEAWERCFYREFLAPSGIQHMMTLSGEPHRGVRPVLTLFRSLDQMPMGEAESSVLERLRPHLVRIMKIHLEKQHLEQRADLLEQTMHALDYPVLLVAESGRVDFHNRAAEQWLAVSSHFSMKDGELKARSPDEQMSLSRSLRQAVREHRSHMRALRCPGGNKPWQMAFFPLPIQPAHSSRSEAVCLVIVVDPQAHASVTIEDLQSLFGLTAATARVALSLAEGKTLQEIATEHGVSINTVRSQIRQVMDKTGSHRQAELVSVVSALPRLRR